MIIVDNNSSTVVIHDVVTALTMERLYKTENQASHHEADLVRCVIQGHTQDESTMSLCPAWQTSVRNDRFGDRYESEFVVVGM